MKIYFYRWHSLPCLELSPSWPLRLPSHDYSFALGVETQGHSTEVTRLVIVTQGLPQAPLFLLWHHAIRETKDDKWQSVGTKKVSRMAAGAAATPGKLESMLQGCYTDEPKLCDCLCQCAVPWKRRLWKTCLSNFTFQNWPWQLLPGLTYIITHLSYAWIEI